MYLVGGERILYASVSSRRADTVLVLFQQSREPKEYCTSGLCAVATSPTEQENLKCLTLNQKPQVCRRQSQKVAEMRMR